MAGLPEVLPPAFPYGGMENPCLTFVTPTLLAGDGSALDVVAHEIIHSWMGNLCTNASWEHFWLNEGFTRFCEIRAMQKSGASALRLQFMLSCRILHMFNYQWNEDSTESKMQKTSGTEGGRGWSRCYGTMPGTSLPKR